VFYYQFYFLKMYDWKKFFEKERVSDVWAVRQYQTTDILFFVIENMKEDRGASPRRGNHRSWQLYGQGSRGIVKIQPGPCLVPYEPYMKKGGLEFGEEIN